MNTISALTRRVARCERRLERVAAILTGAPRRRRRPKAAAKRRARAPKAPTIAKRSQPRPRLSAPTPVAVNAE